MSGFASHLLTVLFQQILLIAAVVAAMYVVIRQRATAQKRRQVRVPVESRQLRRGRETTDNGVTVGESPLGGGRASFQYNGLPDRDSVRTRDPLVDDRP